MWQKNVFFLENLHFDSLEREYPLNQAVNAVDTQKDMETDSERLFQALLTLL